MRLHFALIAEGQSEKGLVGVLTRLCTELWTEVGQAGVDGEWVLPMLAMFGTGKKLGDQLRGLLDHDQTFNLVFVHRDADAPHDTFARATIARGVQISGDGPRVIPVVPIQETEAWLLTDEAAIRKYVGNPNGRAPLGLPKRKQVEHKARPKELLRDVLTRASRPGRQRRSLESGGSEFGRIRQLLLENLDIHGPVTELLAWRALVDDTKAALTELART